MVDVSRRAVVAGLVAVGAAGALNPSASAARHGGGIGRRILVFDVNETLLDVAALSPLFKQVLGTDAPLNDWFTNVVLYSQTLTLAGEYMEFGQVARAAFEMTARARGMNVTPSDADGILRGLVTLPAHSDVRPALDRLKAAGFRLVTLTNSAPAAVEQQLANAGIRDYFERAFSVGAVRKFKPAPEVYAIVPKELGVPASQLRMIAAHPWDVLGAIRAGYAGAFIARTGKS